MTGSQHSRRAVLCGVAAGGLSLPLLNACGGRSTTPVAGPTPGTELADTADVPVGGGKVLDQQKVVLTQPSKGRFRCFSAVCTHQGCLVGEVTDGVIHCPCHGSEFSAEDGSVVRGPAERPLREERITVHDGRITAAAGS